MVIHDTKLEETFFHETYTLEKSLFFPLSLSLSFEPRLLHSSAKIDAASSREERKSERKTNCFSVHVVALSPSQPSTCLLQRERVETRWQDPPKISRP